MGKFIEIDKAAEEILHVSKRMYERGYVAANDGNVSVRISHDRLLVTPTGMSKGFLTRADLVVTDMQGTKISGKHEPTSEIRMHLRAYQLRDDVVSVVHAHPPYATAFAVVGLPLAECVLPEVVVAIGSVPITEYATPSTEEIARSIDEIVKRYDAFLLRNHGVMTVGNNAISAYHKMETVEHFAQITFIARQIGRINPLGHEDVRKLLEVREKLGIRGPIPPCKECGACESEKTIEDVNIARIIAEEVTRYLKGR